MPARPARRRSRAGVTATSPGGASRRAGRAVRAAALSLAAAALIAAGERARASGSGPEAFPRVTVIGDSVGASLGLEEAARAVLSRGVDLDLRLAPCRRIGGASCPYAGARAQTVIELAESAEPPLGATVVVVVGYNDQEELFAGQLDEALRAFSRAGVTRVLWTTLRTARHPYLTMNDALRTAAAAHPTLTVVDWNLYSRSHPEWFQEDGIHPAGAGAHALATLIHRWLVRLGVPRVPETVPARPLGIVATDLPAARTGRPFAVELVARGGRKPYRFTSRSRLPSWLRLSPGGRLSGTPGARAGSVTLRIRVRDATGATASRAFLLRVRAQG